MICEIKDTKGKLELEPKYYKQSMDKCEISFRKKYIEICVTIDSVGNTFHLPYKLMKKGVIEWNIKK